MQLKSKAENARQLWDNGRLFGPGGLGETSKNPTIIRAITRLKPAYLLGLVSFFITPNERYGD